MARDKNKEVAEAISAVKSIVLKDNHQDKEMSTGCCIPHKIPLL
jgi:hypothetical protein